MKRYVNLARIARDGLLVVEHHDPLTPKSEKIVVPRKFLHGLLESLHIKLNHPSKAQLRKVFCRAFYGLDLEPALDVVHATCHTCTSLADMPSRFLDQTTTSNLETIGILIAYSELHGNVGPQAIIILDPGSSMQK